MVLSCVHALNGQRADIYEWFLRRMAHIRNEYGVEMLVVGNEGKLSKDTTEEAGTWYIERENNPVSNKWNEGMLAIRKHNPSHVIILGSDDLISDDLIIRYLKEIEGGFDGIMGISDSYYIALSRKRACYNICYYWPGYSDNRMIGYARCLPSRVLDAVDWRPWAEGLNSGLDTSLTRLVNESGVRYDEKMFSIKENDWLHIDIKTKENISSVSPIARRGIEVEFNDLISRYLPREESEDILSYRESLVDMIWE